LGVHGHPSPVDPRDPGLMALSSMAFYVFLRLSSGLMLSLGLLLPFLTIYVISERWLEKPRMVVITDRNLFVCLPRLLAHRPDGIEAQDERALVRIAVSETRPTRLELTGPHTRELRVQLLPIYPWLPSAWVMLRNIASVIAGWAETKAT
jgi:hypothetical protein